MPSFQNREGDLTLLCDQNAPLLLDIFGEAGIGKTSLLGEAQARFGAQSSPPLVVYLDWDSLSGVPPADRGLHVLKALAAVVPQLAPTAETNEDAEANQIVARLHACTPAPVLMFDTTETVQIDMGFWAWLETQLVAPLLAGGYVRQVFAGRVPAPWRDFDVRTQVVMHHLAPFETQTGPARELILEVFRQRAPALDKHAAVLLTDLILEFSCGHPGLSKGLATWVTESEAERWPAQDLRELRRHMASEEVKRYIDEHLFAKVEPAWRSILWWASILNWFDITVLRQYLVMLVEAGLTSLERTHLNDWDSFFLHSIDRLRLQDTAIIWEGSGYQLYGVTRDIVRYCLRITDSLGYRRANQCAGDVISALAREFTPEEEGFQRYMREAAMYYQQAEGEEIE